jgi:hypothetical protein
VPCRRSHLHKLMHVILFNVGELPLDRVWISWTDLVKQRLRL